MNELCIRKRERGCFRYPFSYFFLLLFKVIHKEKMCIANYFERGFSTHALKDSFTDLDCMPFKMDDSTLLLGDQFLFRWCLVSRNAVSGLVSYNTCEIYFAKATKATTYYRMCSEDKLSLIHI